MRAHVEGPTEAADPGRATGSAPAAREPDDGGGGVGGLIKRTVRRPDRFQREHRLLAFPYAVVKKFGDDQAGNLAALIAYYGFFSLFPLLLVMVTVLGFVLEGHPDLQHRIVDTTLAQFPVIGPQLSQGGVEQGLRGSGVGLAIGLAGLVWGGLGAMQAAQNAMNEVWNVPKRERPSFLPSRLRALLMLCVLGIGVLATTVLAGIGTFGGSRSVIVRLLALVASLVVDLGLFLVAFKVLTDVDLRWRQLVPGAVVAAVGWTALQVLGSFYVGRQLAGASQTYGTFAVVIGLLSWLYLTAQLTVFAAEVNVVWDRRLWPRSIQDDDLTEADRRVLEHRAAVEERLDTETVTVEFREPGDPPAPTPATSADDAVGEGGAQRRERAGQQA